MSKLFNVLKYLVIIWFLLGVLQSPAKLEERWVVVQKAVDGDTLRLQDGRSIRLIGIDAPEIDREHQNHEPMAIEAWRFVSKRMNGKRVRLERDQSEHDDYGRLLAYVYDSDGQMLNRQIVSKGFAHVLYLHPDVKAFERLLIAQRQAMADNEGKWRRIQWVQGTFTGNPRSKRFHRPDCPSASHIPSKNKIVFETERQAFWEGYAPCRRCLSWQKKS